MSSPSSGPGAPYPWQSDPQQPYPQQPYQAPPVYQYPPQQYPYYPPQPVQPLPPHPRTGLIIGVIVTVIVVAIVGVSLVVLLRGGTTGSGPGAVTMSCDQFTQQVETTMNGTTVIFNFRNLKAGDTLIIRGTVSSVSYYGTAGMTTISLSGGSCSFPFTGDLSGTYSNGDIVEITFHVINVDISSSYYQVKGEYFREFVNQQTNEILTSLSPSIIRKVG